jgi:hypothetical protein
MSENGECFAACGVSSPHRAAHLLHSALNALNAARNDGRGVKERAIPVEADAVEAA